MDSLDDLRRQFGRCLGFGFRCRLDFGFGLQLGCCGFGIGFGFFHSVPLSNAVRRPSSICMIRSAYSLMRASWVTIRMQRFSLSIFSLTKAMIILPVSPSREAVGSSRIRISGLLMIARDRHALL